MVTIEKPGTPILDLEQLTLYRGRKQVYQNLTLSFGTGVTALLGPNGAGKTTLIEGLLEPGRARVGFIRMDGALVPDEVQLRSYLSRIGHMPQDWKFFPGFSVKESVEYAAWLKGLPSSALSKAADEAIARVELGAQSKTRVSKLSGGMRQRVGLAEALVNKPRVVLLDEPTVGLDPAQRALFRSTMKRFSDGAVILSTHLTDDVAAVADRVLVVSDGCILFDGTPAELARRAPEDEHLGSPLEAGYLAVVQAPAENRVA